MLAMEVAFTEHVHREWLARPISPSRAAELSQELSCSRRRPAEASTVESADVRGKELSWRWRWALDWS